MGFFLLRISLVDSKFPNLEKIGLTHSRAYCGFFILRLTMTAKKLEPSKGGGKKKITGRPTSYKPEYLEQARKLALLGLTDVEMADIFNVAESTFQKWKKENIEFSESIKKGKALADADVAASLYERACGYEHADIHFSAYEGFVTATPYVKRYPPDTAAAFIWLKNRQSAKWRDKSPDVPEDPTAVATSVKVIVENASKDGS